MRKLFLISIGISGLVAIIILSITTVIGRSYNDKINFHDVSVITNSCNCSNNEISFNFYSGNWSELVKYIIDPSLIKSSSDSILIGIAMSEEYMLQDKDSLHFLKGLSLLKDLCDNKNYDGCAYYIYYSTLGKISEDNINAWENLANLGSSAAMYYQATYAFKEGLLEFSDTLLLENSCSLGNVKSCERLAEIYRLDSGSPNSQKNKLYLDIADSLGSLNAKFDLSLIYLNDLLEDSSEEKFKNFGYYFECGRFSMYPIYVRYFEYGRILLSSEDPHVKDFGERLIVTSSTWGYKYAKDFMSEYNIFFSDYKSNIKLSVIEGDFLNTLKALMNE